MKTISVTIDPKDYEWFKGQCINISRFLRREMKEYREFIEQKEINMEVIE